MRMVVSLADLDDSRWINLTGVSGHPASSHYTDQTDLYVDGQTLPWAFTATRSRPPPRTRSPSSPPPTDRASGWLAGVDSGPETCRASDAGDHERVTPAGVSAKPTAYVVGLGGHGEPDLVVVEHAPRRGCRA